MEITNEMRRAVHIEDCARFGHDLDYSRTTQFVHEEGQPAKIEVGSPDDATLPHLYCRRCEATYLVIPLQGINYEDAERKLYEHLRSDSKMAKEVVRKRGRRAERSPRPRRDHGSAADVEGMESPAPTAEPPTEEPVNTTQE